MSEKPNIEMNQCLRAVWNRAQRKHFVSGLLAFTSWFVPLFILTIVTDRFTYLPGLARGAIAILILALALRQGWRHGWSLLKKFDAKHIAQQIERSLGGMDSLLVTAVQYYESGASPGTSAAMWEHTVIKAEDAAKTVEPTQVVKLDDIKKPLCVALGVVAVLLIIAIIHGSFLIAGLGRLFTPWMAIAYPTKTQIELGKEEMVIREGSPANLEIGLSGIVPKKCKLELQTGKGRGREIELDVNKVLETVNGAEVEKKKSVYEIASASRDFTYRVKAGDARSDWRKVRVIPAPRLAEVNLELDFPDYIDRGNENVEALTLTVPEETRVTWNLKLDVPIRKATLHRDGAEDLPLEIGADKRTLVLSEAASASRGYSFSWTEDRHGFEFNSPRYFLQVASDQVPRIELTSPESNLNAMLGRPLTLAVRAQDDHGIGSTSIIYRVNQRPEVTVKMPKPVAIGEGSQNLDWDYRNELKDLQIGDTVSFVVEVTDKYPGEGEVHRVRTDTRRITFLSREDYLAEVTKQMEKLLARVRTLYRQERAAHELTAGLDPLADSFIPSCQLEAIRQEMIREQLVLTANEVDFLLEDLAANQVSDAVESSSLGALRDALRTIAIQHVARSGDLLRAQVGAAKRDPKPAIDAINQAARELAKLVLKRDIDAAREVYARETTMLSKELATLRLALIDGTPDQAESIAKAHQDVATWTEELLADVTKGIRYDKKPLAVLGLNRRIYHLRKIQLTLGIKKVAELAAQGKYAEAAVIQYPLIRPLIESEFTMRTGSEYALVKNLSERLAFIISEQKNLLSSCETPAKPEGKDDDLATRQQRLRDALVLVSMPSILPPRVGLNDLKIPSAPPSDATRLKAESLMTESFNFLKSNDKDQSISRQRDAIASMMELEHMLNLWAVELAQRSLGVSNLVSDASNRVGALEKFDNRQIALLEQALDEANPDVLIAEQQALVEEIADFIKELSNGEAGPSRESQPLVGRLQAANKSLQLALAELRAKKVDEAVELQEKASEAIAEARGLAGAQLSKLNLLQQLIGFVQSVGKATEGMADIVGGQNDLIDATKDADEKTIQPLLDPQRNLLKCIADIAPALDLVAARLDVGTPLVFAGSDIEDALAAMEDGDGEGASEIQLIAVGSLAKVQALVGEIGVQTTYVAEIVEFLNEAQTDAAMYSFRQRELRDNPEIKDALSKQKALASDVKAYGDILTQVAGKVDFDKLDEKTKLRLEDVDLSLDFLAPGLSMNEAIRLMESGGSAADAMLLAEKGLASNSNQLNVIIEMLNGLPSVTVTSAQPPELHRLIDVLNVASKHRVLLRKTQSQDDKELPALAAEQAKLSKVLSKFIEGEISHPALIEANAKLPQIEAALKASKRADAAALQLDVDIKLRHFIIEQALILNTSVPPASSSDSDVLTESETDDLYQTEAVGFLSDFVSGEAPKDKKTEWDILGNRNRAALNQNFARELPLEYRATLKNYYEKVAK